MIRLRSVLTVAAFAAGIICGPLSVDSARLILVSSSFQYVPRTIQNSTDNRGLAVKNDSTNSTLVLNSVSDAYRVFYITYWQNEATANDFYVSIDQSPVSYSAATIPSVTINQDASSNVVTMLHPPDSTATVLSDNVRAFKASMCSQAVSASFYRGNNDSSYAPFAAPSVFSSRVLWRSSVPTPSQCSDWLLLPTSSLSQTTDSALTLAVLPAIPGGRRIKRSESADQIFVGPALSTTNLPGVICTPQHTYSPTVASFDAVRYVIAQYMVILPGCQRRGIAVTLLDAVTNQYIAVDINNDFSVNLKRGRGITLINGTMSASDRAIRQRLRNAKLSAPLDYVNTDMPDARFFLKTSVSSKAYVLCSLHHQDFCLQYNFFFNRIELYPIGEILDPISPADPYPADPRPNFNGRIGDLRGSALQQILRGYGMYVPLQVQSCALNDCQNGTVIYQPVTGTSCSKYTVRLPGSLVFSGTLSCSNGRALNLNTCRCDPVAMVNCHV